MFTVTVGGIDRTSAVEWKSLRAEQVATSQVDSCRFSVSHDGSGWKPEVGDTVRVEDGAGVVFSGTVLSVAETRAKRLLTFAANCVSDERLLDRKLVVEEYDGWLLSDIVDDVLSEYVPTGGFTSVVAADVTLQKVKFNYEPVSDVFRQLAQLVGYEWYVDEDRVVRFFPPSLEPAPFTVTDGNGNMVDGSLVVRGDLSNLRNVIFVRGGDELGDPQTEELSTQANGTNGIFKLGYGYSGLTVTVNAVPKTVGIENIADPTSVDVLYNFAEKVLKFAVAPAGGAAVLASGTPHVPILLKKSDVASIAEFGEFEFMVVDKTIESRAAARQRAQAELTAYRDRLDEGEFVTFTEGLRAGMSVTVDSALRGHSEDFVVSKVSISMRGPNEASYKATIVTTRTYGIIEYLLGQLRRDAKELDIDGDEILDRTETVEETVGAAESATVIAQTTSSESVGVGEDFASYVDDPPIWVAGPYSPTSLADRKAPAFADRGNVLT